MISNMRNKFLSIVAGVFCSAGLLSATSADYNVVPLPRSVVIGKGDPFILEAGTVVMYPADDMQMKRNAEFLAEYVKEMTDMDLSVQPSPKNTKKLKNVIVLSLDPAVTEEEGYVINVSGKQIAIEGKTPKGVFYGIQTLRKSLPLGSDTIEFPSATIVDSPRFAYRGMMLDVARHFFSVDFVKRYIDLLALHNINTFHWHLSDDQGWRIEIRKYPKLAEIASMRQRTVISKNSPIYDYTPYGGYYTREEAKEIVEYAKERYITVIPEIDLPGHMLAALAAYPELGCTGGPYEVCPHWGIFKDVLCIGKDATMDFLFGVMDEICEIFPSEYVHIGGDECPRDRWKVCPDCQKRIAEEGLKSDGKHSAEDRLQSWCMTQVEKHLNAKGKKIIGWDEILEGDVAPNATVMSWRGMKGGIEAAKLGHDVIMTPTTHVYFDYYQTDKTSNEPFGIGGYLPVEKVYSLEPVPAELTPEQQKHILGAQANLWTEYVLNDDHVEYMVLPRMAALCEVQWSVPEKKDYDDFLKRLGTFVKVYDKYDLQYGKHVFKK